MKINQVILLALLYVCALTTFTNTTEFWKSKLQITDIHYQCYSGIVYLIQVMKILIGFTLLELRPHIIVCFLLMGKV